MLQIWLERMMSELPDVIMAERLQQNFLDSGSYLHTNMTGKHYKLTTGLHAKVYYDLQRAFQHLPTCELCAFILMRKLIKLDVWKSVNVIAGPRRGAAPLIQTLAFFLPERNVRTILMDPVKDRKGKKRAFNPEPQALLTPDDRILLVDDAFTTGGTVRLCIEGCERHIQKTSGEQGACIVGVAVGVNRAPEVWTPERFMSTIPVAWAVRNPTKTYSSVACPECKKKIPLVKVP